MKEKNIFNKKKYIKTSNSSPPPPGEVRKMFFEVPWISPDSIREVRTLDQREYVRSSAGDVKTTRFVVGTIEASKRSLDPVRFNTELGKDD